MAMAQVELDVESGPDGQGIESGSDGPGIESGSDGPGGTSSFGPRQANVKIGGGAGDGGSGVRNRVSALMSRIGVDISSSNFDSV